MADEELSAAQRAKVRRLSAPRELAPDEEGGELNIVPFLDIIMNVLMFVLATVTTTFLATIDSFPPKRGGRGGPATPTLNLTVIVVPEGFSVKASGGSIAPGCRDTGSGITVAKIPGADYDYKQLNACVATVKHEAPDAVKDETSVTISANPNIPYQVIVSTIDACRKDEQGQDLFPDVQFGLSR